MSSETNAHAQGQAQSYPWATAQQGNTFVPGKETRQSRASRANTTIQAVDHHFPNQYVVAQQQGHGPHPQGGGASRNGAGADLNGVGQQFRRRH